MSKRGNMKRELRQKSIKQTIEEKQLKRFSHVDRIKQIAKERSKTLQDLKNLPSAGKKNQKKGLNHPHSRHRKIHVSNSKGF